MKALTLTQPWAQLVALGLKRVETRSWRTNYRGPFAIHAAKGMPHEAWEFAMDEMSLGVAVAPSKLPRGAIVARARLVDVVPVEDVRDTISDREHAYGDYSDGRFAWLLEDVRVLGVPVECRGSLGLWTVPSGLLGGHECDWPTS